MCARTSSDRSFTSVLRRAASPEFATYTEFSKTALQNETGALSSKTRELVAIGVALTTQCEMCLESHVAAAYKQGATRQEVAEAVFVAAALRAGGAVTHGMKAMRMWPEAD